MAADGAPKAPARRKIDFAKISTKILIVLNYKYMESKSYFVPFEDIVVGVPHEPRNAIHDELNNLISLRMVSQKMETRTPDASFLFGVASKREPFQVSVDGFSITRTGIDAVNELPEEAYEILFSETVTDPIPDSKSDVWKPLPLDTSTTEFTKAVAATEEALNAIETHNGFADTKLAERNSIVESIKTNLKNLKEGMISKGQVIEGLIKPLRSVAATFFNASIGELAKRAIAFLLNLIPGT